MAERVHPSDSASSVKSGDPKTPPPPATYVIQLPKNQVYRVPPPENATRFNHYTRQNNRSCPACRRFLLFVAVLLLLFAIATAFFLLILQPLSPRYSILSISINGINLPNSSISPEFNLTFRAENPNKNIGIYYERNSAVTVYYSNSRLCDGALPSMYQPPRNVTVLESKIKGRSGVRLSSGVVKAVQESEKQGKVRLEVELRAPIKLKVYWLKTWRIRAKVSCKIWVKKMTGETKLTEEKCDQSLKLW